jgi:hypothetical protein
MVAILIHDGLFTLDSFKILLETGNLTEEKIDELVDYFVSKSH